MNSRFEIKDLKLRGLHLITPFCVEDERGSFVKSMERDIYAQWGLQSDIYEAFETYSKKGVIRGLHFQTQEPQTKIVQCIAGTIRDVVVDLRKDSDTFGEYEEVILSEDNHDILWIPAGFAHGFEVLSDRAITSYKCIGRYLKEYDTGIAWNDPHIRITWRTENPIVSSKDALLMSFEEFKRKYKGL